LGIAAIGREIENPFGKDVNDLDMEGYIRSLSVELDILTSMPPPQPEDYIETEENCPLGPTTNIPYSMARSMSMDGFYSQYLCVLIVEIRGILRNRVCSHSRHMMNTNAKPENENGNSTVEVV
jgi:hypothetical protein